MLAPEFIALREVCCAEKLQALRERNEERARQARESLGPRYLLHPDNRVRPTPQPRGVLLLGR